MRKFIGICALLICALQVLIAVPDPYVPPKPPPNPDIVIPDVPVIPDPPVEQGRRTLVILYETEQGTDEFARMVNLLQSGANEEYINSKNHTVYVLDDDTKNAEGELADFIKALLPLNSTLPVVYILDSSDGRPLHNETITYETTDEQIMNILKSHGG